MSTAPTVAVVIPARDDARLLARCLAALAQQTRLPDEILVVDDGSHDDTARTARAFDARVVRLDGDGIPAASAAGYDATDARFICRLDADCVPPPTWVAGMVGVLQTRSEVVAVSGGAYSIDGPVALRRVVPRLYLLAYRAVAGAALGHPPLFASSLAFRTEAWRAVRDEVHRDDPEVHDDLDLSFPLGYRGRIVFRADLAVGISSRSFRGAASARRRITRGFHTVFVHWPREFPPLRWIRRARNSQRAHSPAGPKPTSPLL